jgi:predicted TPR repeat methyltransferase
MHEHAYEATAQKTSGNLLADRRFAYALAAFEDKAWQETQELAEQTLELVPHFAQAQMLLGRASVHLGHYEAAFEQFYTLLIRSPEDPLGVSSELVQLMALCRDAVNTPQFLRAPDLQAEPWLSLLPKLHLSAVFVAQLFDQYAARFDTHLQNTLAYSAPQKLLQSLQNVRGAAAIFSHTLDLGCGTGLMGEVIRPFTQQLTGVDLSAKMLEKAAQKSIYDGLEVGELVGFLAQQPVKSTDLILAADVLVYMGDLALLFAACARTLKSAGLFGFTVQAAEQQQTAPYQLGEDARYTHQNSYIEALAHPHHFKVQTAQATSTRKDRGKDVAGLLYILEKN